MELNAEEDGIVCDFCGGAFSSPGKLSAHRAETGELDELENRERVLRYRRDTACGLP